jgi:hypothetical protein
MRPVDVTTAAQEHILRKHLDERALLEDAARLRRALAAIYARALSLADQADQTDSKIKSTGGQTDALQEAPDGPGQLTSPQL